MLGVYTIKQPMFSSMDLLCFSSKASLGYSTKEKETG